MWPSAPEGLYSQPLGHTSRLNAPEATSQMQQLRLLPNRGRGPGGGGAWSPTQHEGAALTRDKCGRGLPPACGHRWAPELEKASPSPRATQGSRAMPWVRHAGSARCPPGTALLFSTRASDSARDVTMKTRRSLRSLAPVKHRSPRVWPVTRRFQGPLGSGLGVSGFPLQETPPSQPAWLSERTTQT